MLRQNPPQPLADAMHRAWVAFAVSGECSWPRYDLACRQTKRFDVECRVVESPLARELALWKAWGIETARERHRSHSLADAYADGAVEAGYKGTHSKWPSLASPADDSWCRTSHYYAGGWQLPTRSRDWWHNRLLQENALSRMWRAHVRSSRQAERALARAQIYSCVLNGERWMMKIVAKGSAAAIRLTLINNQPSWL
jgi:hypothetical protein